MQRLEDGIRRTEQRLKKFETKYQMTTEEFLRRFENDEITHRLDMEFDEWIGESLMLDSLREKADRLTVFECIN